MNARDVIGFFLLALGVAGALGGLGAGLRDIELGWGVLALGLLCLFLSYRVSRAETFEA